MPDSNTEITIPVTEPSNVSLATHSGGNLDDSPTDPSTALIKYDHNAARETVASTAAPTETRSFLRGMCPSRSAVWKTALGIGAVGLAAGAAYAGYTGALTDASLRSLATDMSGWGQTSLGGMKRSLGAIDSANTGFWRLFDGVGPRGAAAEAIPILTNCEGDPSRFSVIDLGEPVGTTGTRSINPLPTGETFSKWATSAMRSAKSGLEGTCEVLGAASTFANDAQKAFTGLFAKHPGQELIHLKPGAADLSSDVATRQETLLDGHPTPTEEGEDSEGSSDLAHRDRRKEHLVSSPDRVDEQDQDQAQVSKMSGVTRVWDDSPQLSFPEDTHGPDYQSETLPSPSVYEGDASPFKAVAVSTDTSAARNEKEEDNTLWGSGL